MKRVLATATAALALLPLGLLPAAPATATRATPTPLSAHQLTWQLTPTGTAARFRGLSAVSRHVAWASGSLGTVLRTTNGGRSWRNVSPPGVAELQFRDIEAFDADTAVALSIGPGDQSRVYRTTDGGAHWAETFRNPDANAFYDCMAFFDRGHGIALSDPVDGKFRVLSTSDGGRSWKVLPTAGMPTALDGEFAFAASGQCITTVSMLDPASRSSVSMLDPASRSSVSMLDPASRSSVGERDAWIASGGGAQARVLHSRDRGLTWTVSATPLASSPSAGVFATAFRDPRQGVAVGGDFANPTNGVDALAFTRDGGRTWGEPSTAPQGYRSGVTWYPFLHSVLLAVGPTGSDLTVDSGRTWRQFDAGSFDTVACARDGACWAAGEQGRVATLQLT